MVNVPPLAIIQARMGSNRLKGKMMLPLAGKPLIWYAHRRSIEAFGEANVVVAIPSSAENHVLRDYIRDSLGGQVFEWDGAESDVLERVWACAHSFRWHPMSVIARITPDDPLKDPALMWAVTLGERHPVELSCEAITLMDLSILHHNIVDMDQREHLTEILSPLPPPEAPEGIWSVDSQEDLDAIRARMGGE